MAVMFALEPPEQRLDVHLRVQATWIIKLFRAPPPVWLPTREQLWNFSLSDLYSYSTSPGKKNKVLEYF